MPSRLPIRTAALRLFASVAVYALALALLTAGPLRAAPAAPAVDVETGIAEPEAAEPAIAVEQTTEESAPPHRAGPPTPIGIRYPEPLEGEVFRFEYDFQRIEKKGILIGDRTFTSTPHSLDVTVHTLEFTYAPHPRVNLVVDLPFVENQLSTNEASGMLSQTETTGVGDVEFALVLPFIKKRRESSHVHLAVKAPTGAYHRGGGTTRLPYDLQLGNGTWDLEWGWTYRGEIDWLAWGGQVVGIHPQGRNGLHYRDGSRFQVTGWSAVRLFAGLSASVRMEWEKINNISGRDRSLDQAADPSNNSKTRGGVSLQISPGLSFDVPQLPHQRIALEATLPLWENLDGAQLKRDWKLEVGWRWGF